MTSPTAHWTQAWWGRQTVPIGVDPDGSAMLYLVRHDGWKALGVGVMGAESNRLDHLESLGWRVVQGWWFDLGFDALEVEEGLIDRWRNLFSLRPRLDLAELLSDAATTAVEASAATEDDALRFVRRNFRTVMPWGVDRADDDAEIVGIEAPDIWLAAS